MYLSMYEYDILYGISKDALKISDPYIDRYDFIQNGNLESFYI